MAHLDIILALIVGSEEKEKKLWMKEWFKKQHIKGNC
jgi:hypothetical protein